MSTLYPWTTLWDQSLILRVTLFCWMPSLLLHSCCFLQADSTQANKLHQLKDVATSDAVLHNTEAASLKEELKAVKLSVSDSEARNAELQTKLESALAEVTAVKANSKPSKVCALLCFSRSP